MIRRGAWLSVLFLVVSATAQEKPAPLRLRIEDGKGGPVPARVHLLDPAGKPYRPDGLPFWRDHFVCAGEASLNLVPGTYRYEIERGPEHTRAKGTVAVTKDGARLTARLERIADLTAAGWYAGELHIHRPVDDVPLLMRAEDLHVGGVLTWWNRQNAWRGKKPPAEPVQKFNGRRYYDLLGGEDERGGGALLYFNRREPLEISAAAREYPSSVKFLREAKKQPGAWADVEKPFWWDVPAWLATGMVDSVGIAHNHMHRGGVMDSEAWGRPRDRERFPGPAGNGLWTQEIYYHILNSGLRVPPSAGSASGVLPNPVGYNRVYVHTGKPLAWADWWAALKAGRSFVTNGPLLLCRAGGQLPGHIFRTKEAVEIDLEAELIGNDAVRAIEVVQDGQVVKAVRVGKPGWKGSVGKLRVEASGWFLVRAVADVPHTFRFASTAPWYVEVGEQPRAVSKRSVDFFLDWLGQRRANVSKQLSDDAQRREVVAELEQAKQFWREQRKKANRP